MYDNGGRNGDESLRAAWEELTAEAQARPWLRKLLAPCGATLAARGATLAARYALWKERLGRLRPGQRRGLQRRLGISLAGAALLLALGASSHAAPTNVITVNGSITSGNQYTKQSRLKVYDSTISNNKTVGGAGGGISFGGEYLYIGGSTLSGNSAEDGGAIAAPGHFTDKTSTIKNSTILGNTATYEGGGLIVGQMVVIGSLISGNATLRAHPTMGAYIHGQGGGMNVLASVTLVNSTLSGNSAYGEGGGVYGTIARMENSTLGAAPFGFAGEHLCDFFSVEHRQRGGFYASNPVPSRV